MELGWLSDNAGCNCGDFLDPATRRTWKNGFRNNGSFRSSILLCPKYRWGGGEISRPLNGQPAYLCSDLAGKLCDIPWYNRHLGCHAAFLEMEKMLNRIFSNFTSED